MRIIARIARLELYNLFYSPIAWVLLIILTFQCGLTYQTYTEDWVTFQELGIDLSNLTNVLFIIGPRSVFPQIIAKLYLYLPLITMALLSREVASGTIKLLYSSPIRIRDIVLGKFLAMLLYNAVLLLSIATLVVVAGVHIQSADMGPLLSGLLGIYLLLCVYAAIGLFMSSLTSYQVVAAIGSITLFTILSYVGTLWQDVDFVRNLTYFLSIAGRTEKMLDGLITSKDVFYYLIIVGLFLALTVYKLQSRRESRAGWVKAGRYATIVALAFLLGYISSRPALIAYYDATATKKMTLTENVQKVLQETNDAPLEVTAYANLLDETFWFGRPNQRNNDLNRWESYIRFRPDIRLHYVYYYDSVARLFQEPPFKPIDKLAAEYAESFRTSLKRFKKPQEIRQEIDLTPEANRYVMQLKYGKKTTFLRIFDDPAVFPSEVEIAAALKRFTTKLPVIAFLTGELERGTEKISSRDYRMITMQPTFRYALVNQGFDIINVNAGQPIPDSITALVIADPRVAFTAEATAAIQAYIDRGGNLLIAGEPDKQPLLNPLLQQFGVSMDTGIMVQQHNEFPQSLILSRTAPAAASHLGSWERFHRDSSLIYLPGAASLTYKDNESFSVSPLLLTKDSLSWNKKGKLILDSAEVVFEPGDGDIRGQHTVALLATRQLGEHEQRVIVVGDADFMSNSELSREDSHSANFGFAVSLFSWFTDGSFPIDASRPPTEDNSFRFTSTDSIRKLKILQLWVLPGLLLIAGSILLIRRNRK